MVVKKLLAIFCYDQSPSCPAVIRQLSSIAGESTTVSIRMAKEHEYRLTDISSKNLRICMRDMLS
jgi:hypothetical protein